MTFTQEKELVEKATFERFRALIVPSIPERMARIIWERLKDYDFLKE